MTRPTKPRPPTLAQLRSEARRVYGPKAEVKEAQQLDPNNRHSIGVIRPTDWYSAHLLRRPNPAACRRDLLACLRALPDHEAP